MTPDPSGRFRYRVDAGPWVDPDAVPIDLPPPTVELTRPELESLLEQAREEGRREAVDDARKQADDGATH